MRNSDMTLRVTDYTMMHDDSGKVLGLRFAIEDGYSPTLKTITVPLHPDVAMEIGAALIANADYLSGRPVRDWDALGWNMRATA